MATCPRCKGHLTEGHRCPRRQSLVAAEIIACAIGGGLVAWLTLIGFDPHGQVTDMDAVLADFGKRTRHEDPLVHFYETFLTQYDPKLRELRVQLDPEHHGIVNVA